MLPLYAIGTLVKKAKLQELQQYLKQQQPLPSDVMECYKVIQQYQKEQEKDSEDTVTSSSSSTATTTIKTTMIGPLQRALTKRKGTLSVIAEYKRPSGYIDNSSSSSSSSKQQQQQQQQLPSGIITTDTDRTTGTSSSSSSSSTTTTTGSNIWDLDVLSPIFREAGVTGIAILADPKIGNCNYESDLPFCVQEQDRIRKANLLPDPMFIINSDIIVDPIQIARTAAIRSATSSSVSNSKNNNMESNRCKSEIAAIVIQYNIVVTSTTTSSSSDIEHRGTNATTAEDTSLLVELLHAARALDLEVIVTVTHPHQAQTVIDLGVSIVNVMAPVVTDPILASTITTESTTTTPTTTDTKLLRTNNTFVDAQIACIENIKYPAYNQNVCFLAQIPVKSDNTQWNEIEDVWYLRDTQMFQGIYVSDVLYKGQVASTTFTGSNDRMEHPGSIIKAMISKSSKVWGVVTTKSGRGEGAREYLGDIMM